ncbi:MAG: hypothetical protein HC840_22510 [Leptolyngbyaceae cyanobacterium RM2_2_4]|nr:hypothetical protein [Leptolyngbyaceae cyanobacterium SM1_4_3]NJN91270.1 hypothetical protein [Leptolyngbyaceae cyanobacterium SL_5_14]NJO51727.1 hypothetical protein [Leptolyngbyaceae cyanobacterium RM2_2_4]
MGISTIRQFQVDNSFSDGKVGAIATMRSRTSDAPYSFVSFTLNSDAK